jgi:rhodanese-related sulfurtransferase
VPQRVETAGVERLIDLGAQIVEVLPPSAFEREHLPGAQNIPLESMQLGTVSGLDPDQPTVVYCYDYECDLSARAARRLETLGFSDVYDYTASKAAWMADGLPVEGTVKNSSRAGAIARVEIPRCSLGEKLGDVRDRLDGEDLCAVIDDDEILLGVVREATIALPDSTLVDEVLQPAPPTVRPSVTGTELVQSMEDDGRTYVFVTTLGGKLIGVIHRSDLHGQH